MILKLHQAGQPVLRKSAAALDIKKISSKNTQTLIDFMIATLRDAPGVGLAAPQVGENLRIIILEDKAKYHEQVPKDVLKAQARKSQPLRVLINPELEIIDADPEFWFEGCLSVDGYVAAVSRARAVRVKAYDRHAKPLTIEATGWTARTLQHEMDHLDGKLYLDQMSSKSFMSTKNFNMLWRKALQPKIKKAFSE